jgi:signal transduction histidine kinase
MLRAGAMIDCPQCGTTSSAFRAMSDAVLAVSSERSVSDVLKTLAETARELVRARYAAIGVPDGDGGFAQFIAAGMTDKQWDAIGELPRTHGLLGATLETTETFRATDIMADPRFQGWPAAHPNMRSFLGVPILYGDEIVGAFYLTEKKGRRRAEFTDTDQQLIEALAPHAAVAIANARLYERSRELSVVEERNRLARELHDAVNQTLFSVSLTAEAAALLVDGDPEEAKRQIHEVQQLAREAMDEMRSLIFELRPAVLGADGLVATLRKHAEVLERVSGKEIAVEVHGDVRLEPHVEREVFRIAQEALGNALKHARPEHMRVSLQTPDHRLSLRVTDDGSGFDPADVRTVGKHLGLVSMRERAESIGGELSIESSPGAGTTVSLEVALG